MLRNLIPGLSTAFFVMLASAILLPAVARAHCDTMDGPVVKAAQKALETGDVNLVLIWVQKVQEDEVKAAFQKTLDMRKLDPKAKELADMYFFETVVRLHRAGEGAPYTGLKPSGTDLGPAVPAADKALEVGDVGPLLKIVVDEAQEGIRKHYEEAVAAKKFDKADVDAGRKYVKAYVEFVHYVERLHEDAISPAEGHESEAREGGGEPAEEHGQPVDKPALSNGGSDNAQPQRAETASLWTGELGWAAAAIFAVAAAVGFTLKGRSR